MSFAQIAGHEGTLQVLKKAVLTGRIPQAYLFVGPSNVGKTLTAVELAKALNCETLTAPETVDDIEPCDQCSSCVRIEKGIHPDFRIVQPLTRIGAIDDEETEADPVTGEPSKKKDEFVQMEGAEIRISQVRELIESASLMTNQARRRMYIITGAETMNIAAANAFLKTLEEPSAATTFVLTTASPNDLLPTIVSRCQVVNFHPVPAAVARDFLVSRYPEVSAEQIQSIVAMSSGRIGWAIKLLQQPDVLQIRSDLLDLCVRLAAADWVECLRGGELLVDAAERWWLATNEEEIAEKALKASRDRVLRTSMGDILDILATWFRDLLLLSSDAGADGLINMDRAEQLRDLAGRYDAKKCEAACEHLQRMHAQLGQNANLRLAAENLALRLIVT